MRTKKSESKDKSTQNKKKVKEAENNPQAEIEVSEPESQPQVEMKVTEPESKPQKIKVKKSIGHEARTNRWGYVFVAPFVIVFCVFNLWPTLYTFTLSFTDLRGLKDEYVFRNAECPNCRGEGKVYETCKKCEGLRRIIVDDVEVECPECEGEGSILIGDCKECHGKGTVTPFKYNYKRLVTDTFFWGALGNTMIIWTFNFIPQLGLALILSIWLSDIQLNLVGKSLFRAVIYMPNLLTAVSVALLFRSIFGYAAHVTAPANQFLYSLGIQATKIDPITGETVREAIDFFRNVAFSRGLVAFIQWWMWYGYTMIILMAGITTIPISLYESASIDGANSSQTTWYITLPLLRPIMLYILVTSMIGGMQMFDIPFLLTDMSGNPRFGIRTTTVYQYNVALGRGANDYAYGAAISIGIFIITIFLALLIFFFLQDRSELKKKKGGAV
jgi:multiple sugar transport system permease protein